jgi:hypothetical protein
MALYTGVGFIFAEVISAPFIVVFFAVSGFGFLIVGSLTFARIIGSRTAAISFSVAGCHGSRTPLGTAPISSAMVSLGQGLGIL